MKLNYTEISYLGTDDKYFNTCKFRRRRLAIECGILFACNSYTIIISKGYERYIPLASKSRIGEVSNVCKYMDKDQCGFHPTYAAESITLEFKHTIHDTWSTAIDSLRKDIRVITHDNKIQLSVLYPVHEILEMDILPHNNGFTISLISRY